MPNSDPIAARAADWVSLMHSGEATEEDRNALSAWRNADPRHEEAYIQVEAIWRRTGSLQQDPLTGFARPSKRKPKKKPLLLVAVLGLMALAAIWSSTPDKADHSTGTAEVRAVLLPDGSRVTLNARSAINVRYTDKARQIQLVRGRAYFEVASGGVLPFRVEAEGVEATALGTAFEVARHDDIVSVAVAEHTVAVRLPTIGTDQAEVRENQQILVRNKSLGAIEPANREGLAAWRRGTLFADSATLADVVEELRAYHPGWIVVAGSSTRSVPINAILDLRNPVRALDALGIGLNLRVRHIGRYLTIITAD